MHDFIAKLEWDNSGIAALIYRLDSVVPSNLRRLVRNLLPYYFITDLEMAEAYAGYPEDYREVQSYGSLESQSTDDLQEALDRIKEELRKREESSE